ncbi:hypothetical protein EJ04DRAFT_268062 [Polyplosphaeria fusca]|uniref:Uncharacterized protein n=1 Tax=Polyplosphaeria fusca TaxID=682080 RepID=A0A9P4QTL8_9PLEO|nr:hypothetical protein EJ04DRAFT_268062 [Polyplosphaeria fusca]
MSLDITTDQLILPQLDTDSPPPRSSTSPRFHHIYGLPHAQDYPYISRHEARRQGVYDYHHHSTSPSQQARSPSGSNVGPSNPQRIDYSNTVYYPRPRSSTSSPSPRPSLSQPQTRPHQPRASRNSGRTTTTTRPRPSPIQPHRTPSNAHTLNVRLDSRSPVRLSHSLPATTHVETLQASGSVTVDTRGRPVSVALELAEHDVERMHRAASRASNGRSKSGKKKRCDGSSSSETVYTIYSEDEEEHRRGGGNGDSFSSLPLETPDTIGGVKMELRGGGGGESSRRDGTPRLRGGDGERGGKSDRVPLEKRGGNGLRIDANARRHRRSVLNDGRVMAWLLACPSPEALAWARGTAAAAAAVWQYSQRTTTTTAHGIHQPDAASNRSPDQQHQETRSPHQSSRFHEASPHHHTSPSTTLTPNTSTLPISVTSPAQPLSWLRGGANSFCSCFSPKHAHFHNHGRVPANLYRLPGVPVTTTQWHMREPQHRMGRLFELAGYGTRAGMPYASSGEKGGEGGAKGGAKRS